MRNLRRTPIPVAKTIDIPAPIPELSHAHAIEYGKGKNLIHAGTLKNSNAATDSKALVTGALLCNRSRQYRRCFAMSAPKQKWGKNNRLPPKKMKGIEARKTKQSTLTE